MSRNKSTSGGGRRRQVPSHDPMPGADESPIEPGATQGAQLPPKAGKAERDSNEPGRGEKAHVEPGPNPNQGDLPGPFWSD